MLRVYNGNDTTNPGNPRDDKNWNPISIRNNTYEWIASGSGTNEYYCRLNGGGDPGLPAPTNVQEGGVDMTEGTMGSLALGEWDYGDNDTLGYSTIYVRINAAGPGDVDPDVRAVDNITFTDTLNAGDDVYVPSSAGPMDVEVDLSDVQIRSFRREPQHGSALGVSDANPLRLNIGGSGAYFEFDGSGDSWINLGTSAIAPLIRGSGNGVGGYGLRLQGTAFTGYTQRGGNVVLVGVDVSIIEALAGTLLCDRNCLLENSGSGVISNMGATVIIEADADDIRNREGTLTVNGDGVTLGDVLCDGGEVILNNSGLTDKAQADGEGVIDFLQDNTARTVTDVGRSGNGKVKYDPDILTITNAITSSGPMTIGNSNL